MKSELLPYKFKSLKFQCEYNENKIVQLGWKARKYIKWSDVHVKNDRDLLKKFGDLAVDKKIIDGSLFPRVNEILLNVQRWRLDKEGLSMEPEHEPAWDKARNFILASGDNKNIILSYLLDYFKTVAMIPDEKLFSSFSKLILFELFISVRKISDIRLVEKDVCGSFDELLKLFMDNGYELPEFDGLNTVSDVFLSLGLPALENVNDLSKIGFESKLESQIVIVETKMETSRIFKVNYSKEFITVYLNVNNECVKFVDGNKELSDFFIRFIKAYAKTSYDNPVLSEHLDDFNSYLALNLNREFLIN